MVQVLVVLVLLAASRADGFTKFLIGRKVVAHRFTSRSLLNWGSVVRGGVAVQKPFGSSSSLAFGPAEVDHITTVSSAILSQATDVGFQMPDIFSAFDQFVQGSLNSATGTQTETLSSALAIPASQGAQLVAPTETSKTLMVLGNDLLIFLCSTIAIVPLFKYLKASPVIGFLTAGLIMGPAGLGLFSDLNDMESLADAGVLFLLFEQGLELTIDRLKSLSKYAFGMGTLQVVLSTAAFFIFPFIGGVQFLEVIMKSDRELVDITRVDEALVIGAALSLSSSAFVLKILQEKNQLSSKYGSAALGVLLLQDIAVVPLLVLLPIIENTSGPMPLSAQLTLLGGTFLKAILGLGGILVIGGKIVRYLFSLVAASKSSETFIALVLLVALGTGALTDSLGLSSTLGAFTAGTLLAESNYRTQIESDIKPFRGLLLGLFFLTTGASVDPSVIRDQATTVIALLAGLISFKAIITTSLGPLFGLSKAESIKTGILLSGGGEFAFVVLTLADKLNVLPDELAKVLVGVVVLSMALTPYLAKIGDYLGDKVEIWEKEQANKDGRNPDLLDIQELERRSSEIKPGDPLDSDSFGDDEDVIVICGFNPVGQTVANFLLQPNVRNTNKQLTLTGDGSEEDETKLRFIAFDLDPNLVVKQFRKGKRVLYGDGTQPNVLETAGVKNPRTFIVTYSEDEENSKAVKRLRSAYPNVPIFARSSSEKNYIDLMEAGATKVLPDETEASLRMAFSVLTDLGVQEKVLDKLVKTVRTDLEEVQDEKFQEYELQKLGIGSGSLRREIKADGSPFERFNPFGDNIQNDESSGPLQNIRTRMRENLEKVTNNSAFGSKEDKASNSAEDDGWFEEGQVDGVDICKIPEKKGKKLKASSESDSSTNTSTDTGSSSTSSSSISSSSSGSVMKSDQDLGVVGREEEDMSDDGGEDGDGQGEGLVDGVDICRIPPRSK